MTNEEYFKLGKISSLDEFKKENLVLNASSLQYLDKSQGGSTKKLANYLLDIDKEIETNKSLTRGNLLHLYIENPDLFVVSEVDKPSDKLGEVADLFLKYLNLDDYYNASIGFLNSGHLNKASKEDAQKELDAAMLEIKELTLKCCRELEYQKNYKDETIKEKIPTLILPYLEEVLKNTGKLILTKSDKIVIQNCINSLAANELTYKWLFQSEFSKQCQIECEKIFTFEYLGYNWKIKLDRQIIDHVNKKIYIIDLKTTSNSIYQFKKSLEQYRYYRQAFLYVQGLKIFYSTILELADYEIEFKFIPVETVGINQSTVLTIGKNYYALAEKEIKSLVSDLDYCFKNNTFLSLEENECKEITLDLLNYKSLDEIIIEDNILITNQEEEQFNQITQIEQDGNS